MHEDEGEEGNEVSVNPFYIATSERPISVTDIGLEGKKNITQANNNKRKCDLTFRREFLVILSVKPHFWFMSEEQKNVCRAA